MKKDTLLFEQLISNPDAFAICRNIIQPEFFNKEISGAVRYVLKYADQYKGIPSPLMIEAETGVQLNLHEDAILPTRMNWICDEIEKHCRIEQTILAIQYATELIAEDRLDEIVDPIKNAVLLSTNRDLGLNYLSDPTDRLQKLMDRSNILPLGFNNLDEILYGGIERGGLNIVAAGSGGGKSYFMLNVALNWMLQGKHVLYISLELSQSLVAKRLDSMVSGVDTRSIFKRIDDVAASIATLKTETGGHLQIKYLPPQSKVNAVEAYLNEYMIRTGKRPDLMIIDYLELLMPNHTGVDINDHFVKDKFTSENLRAMFTEYGLFALTASQLNRSAVTAEEHDQSNIAGGISKINTADNVFTMFQSAVMRHNNLIRFQFLKTRNAAGVGRTTYLQVDPATVRYSDAPEDADKLATTGKRNQFVAKTGAAPRTFIHNQSAADKLSAIKKNAP